MRYSLPKFKKHFFILVIFLFFFIIGCSGGNIFPYSSRDFRLGFSSAIRMPIKSDSKIDYQNETLRLIAGYGEIVLIETNPFKGIEEFKRVKTLVDMSKKHTIALAFGINFFDERNYGFLPKGERFNNSTTKEEIKNYLKELMALKPSYLGIGLDVYKYKFVQPADYKAFVEFYNALYPELKKISTGTKIAPVFDYELLIDQQDFEALKDFENSSDFIGLITFPLHWPVIVSPESIRENYYSQFGKFLNGKKIGIFQLGYPSDNGSDYTRGDFYSNLDGQRRFLESFPRLVEDLPLEFVIWRFLFDYPEVKKTSYSHYFRTTGFLDEKREPKPAFEIWKQWSQIPYYF